MKKSFLAVLLGALLVFSITSGASATLIGDDVTFDYVQGTTYDYSGSRTVADGLSDEFYAGTRLQADVNAASISIFLRDTRDYTGAVLTISDLNDDSLNALSSVNDASFATTAFGDDWVSFTLNSSYASGWYTATLDFSGAVIGGGETASNTMHNPIPAPILLLGTGLVGLAGFRRRIKK